MCGSSATEKRAGLAKSSSRRDDAEPTNDSAEEETRDDDDDDDDDKEDDDEDRGVVAGEDVVCVGGSEGFENDCLGVSQNRTHLGIRGVSAIVF